MGGRVPIFASGEDTFWPDTCDPLRTAAAAGQVTLQCFARGHYPGRALPAGVMPHLKTVGFWDAPHDQTWGLNWHRNEGLEITYLEHGHVDFAAGETGLTLRPGDLTITRPWQLHRVGAPNVPRSRLHWVIIDLNVRRPNQDWHWPSWVVLSPPDLRELTRLLRGNETTVWRASSDVHHAVRRLGDTIARPDSPHCFSELALRVNELLLQVLAMLVNERIATDDSLMSSERVVQMFLRDLESNPNHLGEEWTVNAMARHCGLGVTRFVECVRQVTNTTPMQYVNGLRLQRAAALLSGRPEQPITEIAMSLGFSSTQYFSTVFRRQYRCTPSEFRRRSEQPIVTARC